MEILNQIRRITNSINQNKRDVEQIVNYTQELKQMVQLHISKTSALFRGLNIIDTYFRGD